MNSNTLLRSLLHAFAMCLPLPVLARVGESTGNIVGLIDNLGSGAFRVTVSSPSTGRSRTVTVAQAVAQDS